ncbi:hypothetical protein PFISCL1PPCAC_25 [Pristionchus fissidentatus]|uniref:PLD phosphodiesterase domain-containing protein n=1 Tax=Pristionchus fissidentatus TaxID=1538716 RepID=A0AAV5UR74_9BILA|nr:hypothetical protein PFISCL1PPCAC_25 [Pristionchus fissidentatus]
MIPIGETHDGRADMTNFEMDLFDTRMHTAKMVKDEEDSCCSGASSRKSLVKPACLPITILSCLIIALVFLPLFKDEDLEAPVKMALVPICKDGCSLSLVESIPRGVSFPSGAPSYPSTWEMWKKMIDETNDVLDIAAFYWNLSDDEAHPSSDKGSIILDALIRAGQRGVKIRIAQNAPTGTATTYPDSEVLRVKAHAEIRNVNMSRLFGSGVLHTKFLISDMKRVYVGSANMDWKSLTEVKELGVYVGGCECVATDLYRIFSVYWRLGEEDARIPPKWPISYRTPYNFNNPMEVNINDDVMARLFISSSPQPFSPKGREDDLEAIVALIGRSTRSVSVAVMDFLPMTLYMPNNTFWPSLDVSLRDAAFRGVAVRLLVSQWEHSKKAAIPFLRSLEQINEGLPSKGGKKGSITVRVFTVPPTGDDKIPFTRVNHNKYMVADNVAYIGTSNWAGDYFINTAGVGFALKSAVVSNQLQAVFDRDWTSQYAADL